LYDRVGDPNEHRNLAGEARLGAVKARLAAYLPKSSAAPKPNRDAFDFDFKAHSYRRKGG
jgi:hypothetical protein